MFRKISLLVLVTTFAGMRADNTTETGNRFVNAMKSAGSAIKGFVVAAVTPSTYTNAASSAWNSVTSITLDDVKAAPGNTVTAIRNNPGKTALVAASAAAVVAGIYAYLHPEVLGFDTEEEDQDITLSTRNKDKKATTYFIGQE